MKICDLVDKVYSALLDGKGGCISIGPSKHSEWPEFPPGFYVIPVSDSEVVFRTPSLVRSFIEACIMHVIMPGLKVTDSGGCRDHTGSGTWGYVPNGPAFTIQWGTRDNGKTLYIRPIMLRLYQAAAEDAAVSQDVDVVYSPSEATERGTISGRKLIHRRERGDYRVNQGSPILV